MVVHRLVLLVVGVFACSTAVIMIKLTDVNPLLLSAYRLLVAAFFLLPVWLRSRAKHGYRYGSGALRICAWPALFLGLHFVTWIIGARMTLAANASLIVNMVPVAMPFLAYALWRELINRGEAVGTVLALSGVVFLGAADYHISQTTFLGDLVCLVSMLFFAAYLALGRRSRELPDIWLYIVPVYAIAGVLCLAAAVPFVNPVRAYSARDVAMIVGLGLIPTVVGHSVLQYSMKHMRPQLVAIGTLGQFVFAGIMAFFLLAEAPTWTFYLSSALLVTGAVIAIRATPPVGGVAASTVRARRRSRGGRKVAST